MLIVCPSCASEYAVDPDRIGSAGRNVRCAGCRTAWFVPGTPPADEPVEAISPAPMLPILSGPAVPATIDGVAGHPGRGSARRAGGKAEKVRPPRASGRVGERLALATAILVASAAPVAIALREPLVRTAPATAALFAALGLPVNLVGLGLTDVSSSLIEQNGAPVLTVEGTLRSGDERRRAVPRLEYVIESDDGAQLYRWSTKPPVEAIAGGEQVRFAAQLASPPPAGKRVVVTFAADRGHESVALR